MNSETRSRPATEPAAFTYIMDKRGSIYISNGLSIGNVATGALVYYSDRGGLRRDDRGGSFTKFLFRGTRRERRRAAELLPSEIARAILSQCVDDSVSGAQALALPEAERIFSPEDAIPNFLSDARTTASERRALSEALTRLQRAGADLKGVGLYGGLQCQIRPERLHDLDLLVTGIVNYSAIVEASVTSFSTSEGEYLREGDTAEVAVTRRRLQLSQYHVSGTTTVDCKIVDSTVRWPGFPTSAVTEPRDVVGVIEDAAATLCMPAKYRLRSNDELVDVYSPYYHHLGAGTTGDRVIVRGVQIDDSTVVVADPDRDFVVPAP